MASWLHRQSERIAAAATGERLFTCTYGATTYQVRTDLTKSPYYGRWPQILSLSLLAYYPTIDDPVLQDLAAQLESQLAGRDDRTKTAVALSFVQQNMKYVADKDQYGLEDMWALPVNSLDRGQGDCDCMAILFAGIAANLGLDIILVCTQDHMFPAVCYRGGHGVSYQYDNKTYFHLETTDRYPVSGRYWAERTALSGMAKPLVPTMLFEQNLGDWLPKPSP